MKKFISILTLVCSMAITGQALAVSLTLAPASQTIYQGNNADVYLGISDLGKGVPPSLGAFKLDITFDSTILTLVNVNFDKFLGDPSLSQADFIISSNVPGTLNLEGMSFLVSSELDALQGGSFNLAKLTFTGTNLGSSLLSMENVVLSDAYGFELLNPTLTGASVNVVPEPGTFILLGLGLAGLVGYRKKCRKV